MTRLLLFLFAITSFQTYGQTKTIRGEILADSLQGYAINIVNFTKEIGTTNDEKGFFEIPAAVGDSIVFSSVQYQIKSIIVTQEHFKKDKITIVLFPVIQQLEQVKISNVQLSGRLDKDARIVELQPFVDNQILGLPFSDKPQPTLIERRIYTARSGIIEAPINYLNGTIKKLKRIKALEDLDKLVQQGERTFTVSFFMDELGLPENLISDFMYYCAEDNQYENLLENPERLVLLEFFQEKSKAYKAYKEKE